MYLIFLIYSRYFSFILANKNIMVLSLLECHVSLRYFFFILIIFIVGFFCLHLKTIKILLFIYNPILSSVVFFKKKKETKKQKYKIICICSLKAYFTSLSFSLSIVLNISQKLINSFQKK